MKSQIPDMTKLSRSQGFRLHSTNCEELLAIRVLVVALIQTLVLLVQAHVDLVQTHPPQGGLIWLLMGPGTGSVGAV